MRISVDVDRHRLTGMDVLKVGFLEVGFDPDVLLRDDADDRDARRDIVAHLRLLAENPVEGRAHGRAFEIERRVVARRLGLHVGGVLLHRCVRFAVERRHSLGDALLQHSAELNRRVEVVPRGVELRLAGKLGFGE